MAERMITHISKPERGIVYAWEGEVPALRAALGKCITALGFEMERAVNERDEAAAIQIKDALDAAYAALKQ
jgi:hypothetical protein